MPTTNPEPDKVTVYVDHENSAWLDGLPGKSRSWKINECLTKLRQQQAKDPFEQLLVFLEEQEQHRDSMYMVAVMDKLGAVTKGKISLSNLLRAYMRSSHSLSIGGGP